MIYTRVQVTERVQSTQTLWYSTPVEVPNLIQADGEMAHTGKLHEVRVSSPIF